MGTGLEYFMYIPLFLALYMFTTYFLSRIRNFPPSPAVTLPFLGHLHLVKKPLHLSLAKISNKFGPILLLRFGSRRVLLVSSPSAAEECLSKNDIIFANRPRLIAGKHLGYDYKSMVWSSYGDYWRNLRRITTIELLSSHQIQMLQGIRADETRSMIRRLLHLSGSAVDMKMLLLETLMNVTMRMIAGKRYYGESVEDMEQAKQFKHIVFETSRYAGVSNVGDFLPLLRWLGVGRGLEKGMLELQKKRDSFMQQLVEECKQRMKNNNGGTMKKKKKKEKRTMLETLLCLQEKEPENYTDEIIKSQILSLLGGGTETSSATIEWALSLLLNNPQVLKKAQTEIENHVGHDRLMEESDLCNLPYLRCIIQETMRMYPAGPLLVPHESSKPCTVGGYHVPEKTILLVNVAMIQNDPKNWEDPGKFKPERFEVFDGSEGRFKLLPFSFGRRGCPGEALAFRLLGLGLGSVLQCFEWERIGESLVDMVEGNAGALAKAQPLVAYCKARPFVSKLLS